MIIIWCCVAFGLGYFTRWGTQRFIDWVEREVIDG